MYMDNASVAILAWIGISILLLIAGIYFYYKDTSDLSNWKTAKAEVKISELQNLPGRGVAYTANVVYSYEYRGKTYEGKCCSYGSGDYDRWKTIVDSNKAGGTATVLLDPEDPSKSILKDSIQPLNILNVVLIATGAIGVITGLASFYFATAKPAIKK